MRNMLIGAAASAVILAGASALAQSQQDQATSGQEAGQPGQMMGQAGQGMPMMGHGMMGRGHHHAGSDRHEPGERMGRGMRPHMMLMMVAMMDADGSGTLSLEEIQAVHARMFGYADTDDDGELSMDEIRAFLRGRPVPAGE